MCLPEAGAEARELVIHTTAKKDFESLHELAGFPSGCYCTPLSDTFSAFDAILLPSILLQMTVSKRHSPVSPSAVDEIIKVSALVWATLCSLHASAAGEVL